jgi:hypothetical protein
LCTGAEATAITCKAANVADVSRVLAKALMKPEKNAKNLAGFECTREMIFGIYGHHANYNI